MSGGFVHHFASLGGIFRGLVADETVSSGGMVFVHGDLERFNGVLGSGVERAHSFVKLSGAHVFTVRSGSGDLADKDVAVLVSLGKVGSKERVVEGETSARLASDVEISQEFGGLLVHFFVFDVHNTGVEWLGGVSADLRLGLEFDTNVLE